MAKKQSSPTMSTLAAKWGKLEPTDVVALVVDSHTFALSNFCSDIRRLCASVRSQDEIKGNVPPRAWHPTHRHVKRGTVYRLLGIGKMQSENWRGGVIGARYTVDMREVAIYQDETGRLWARPIEEFGDGRFEVLE